MEKIYIKCGRQKTVREFIQKAFVKTTSPHYIRLDVTYLDPECTQIQCSGNKYRSVEAIHKLIKTYYPSYTITKTVKALCQPYLYRNSFLFPNFINCNEINKIIFLYYYYCNAININQEYSELVVDNKKLIDAAKELDLDSTRKLEKHIKDEYNKLNKS